MKSVKIKLLTIVSILIISNMEMLAQKSLPDDYSISLGTGLMLPAVNANESDFFSKNGNKPGYELSVDARYYGATFLGLGMRYDYLRSAKYPDKMHVHYVAPNLVLRYLFNDDSQDIYFGVGIGYMNYQERVYGNIINSKGVNYGKSYCGLSFTLGYEFTLLKNINGTLKADFITADWFVNPDARLFNPDPDYDDGIDHTIFKNNITFVNLGFALMFGK